MYLVDFQYLEVQSVAVLRAGAIVNRTYGTDKSLDIYLPGIFYCS